jgi:PAS domain S-box-containing protein
MGAHLSLNRKSKTYEIHATSMLLTVLAIVGGGEWTIMWILHTFFPGISAPVENALDSTFLTLTVTPAIWFVLVRPLSAKARDLVREVERRQSLTERLHSQTAFLDALANSTLNGILVVDERRRKRFQNSRFIEIFRLPREIVEDESDQHSLAYVLQQLEDPQRFVNRVDYLYAHPDEVSEEQFRLTDGRVIDRFSSPIHAKDGNRYGRIWVFRDVTEQLRNAGMLHRLSIALEQSPVSVLMTDLHGAITYVNRKFVECTGYSYEEVIGQNPRMLKSGKTSAEQYRQMWETISSGREWRGEFCNRKKNGELFWEMAVLCPLKDEAGKTSHFLAIKEDITERRFLEQQLYQAQKLEGIGQLASGIAHEINTPTQFVSDNLTFMRDAWKSIAGLLEQYRAAVRSEAVSTPAILEQLREAERECDLEFIAAEVPRAIEQGLEGTQRVAKIVRAMKDFSHPDSVDKTATDLNKAIESTVTVARNEWKYVAELTTEFDRDLPAVMCYPSQVEQVILNLVVNSAHAIKERVKEGEEKGRITVRTKQRGEMAEISITDTGTGIPESIRSKVFDPFFTTKEVGKGTGPGLALAHGVIVKKHGGQIWFESEVGKGTTFYIHLPISLPNAMGAAQG